VSLAFRRLPQQGVAPFFEGAPPQGSGFPEVSHRRMESAADAVCFASTPRSRLAMGSQRCAKMATPPVTPATTKNAITAYVASMSTPVFHTVMLAMRFKIKNRDLQHERHSIAPFRFASQERLLCLEHRIVETGVSR